MLAAIGDVRAAGQVKRPPLSFQVDLERLQCVPRATDSGTTLELKVVREGTNGESAATTGCTWGVRDLQGSRGAESAHAGVQGVHWRSFTKSRFHVKRD
jgi:hypothetical protein